MTRIWTLLPTQIFTIFLITSSFAQVSDLEIDSIYQQGLRYLDQYHFDEAVKCLYLCQRERHGQPVYHYALAQAYEQMGNIQDARLFYKKAHSLDSLEVKYLMALGNIELQRRDYDSAQSYFRTTVGLDSTNSFYHKQLGKACYYANDLACALQSFQYSIFYNNRDLETVVLMAQIYYDNQNYEACLEWIMKGLRLDAKNPRLLNLKLRSEVKLEDYELALLTADRILETGDSSYQVLKFYGIALNKTEHYESAIEILEPLLGQKEDEGLHFYLGDSYGKIGNPEKSISHLEIAAYSFGIGPMVWRYFFTLSGLYSEIGNTKLALRYMERTYDLHPEPLLLYQLARLTDLYYLDKQMAVNRYNQYLATEDSLYREHAMDRISELKRHLHQSNVK